MAQGSLKLSTDTYFRPLGLHHFYEAFSIEGKANLRQDARAQFGLQEAELTSDLTLTAAAVLRMQWGQHKEQSKAPPARTASTRAMNRMNCLRMPLVLLSVKTVISIVLC